MQWSLVPSFERVLSIHCLAALDLGARCWAAMRLSLSSSRVRPCSPWGPWIGHWRLTWSTVCSSAPHSQAAEDATADLHRQERKRLTPVRRRLSRTQAVLVPVYHVPRTGRCPRAHWHLGEKLISSFLNSTHVFLQELRSRSWAFCKEPELRLNFRSRSYGYCEVASAPFLDTNRFAKFTESCTYTESSALSVIVTNYDARLQEWICDSLMFPWFRHR